MANESRLDGAIQSVPGVWFFCAGVNLALRVNKTFLTSRRD